MESYEITIEDMIQNDDAFAYNSVSVINISGDEEYDIAYKEDSSDTYCADDVYFTLKDGENRPLNTTLVSEYLSAISSMSFDTYVSYNATDEELAEYGLDDPELTVSVDYGIAGETAEDEYQYGTYTLSISRSAEERLNPTEESESTDTESEDTYSAYVRIGDSKIIYEVSSDYFETLMASGYDDLRHKEVYTGSFDIIDSMDIELEGNTYTLAPKSEEETEDEDETEDESSVWAYGDEEIDISTIQSAMNNLTASEFTDEEPEGEQEVKITLNLTDENFPQVEIVFYRYDGTNCLATVDGESFALVSRSSVVDFIEAVNAIVLN